MPLIKPRTRGKKFVRLVTGLDRESHETLYAYAQFIGEKAEYVLNQLLQIPLAKGKQFVALRAEHPDSYVPLPDRERPEAEPGYGERSRTAIVPDARRGVPRRRWAGGRGDRLAMIRHIVAARGLVAMSVAAVIGTWVCSCIRWIRRTRSSV